MATPKVLLKRSSVSSNAPTASDLEYGELAINFADGRIYYKNSSNEIKNFIDSDILTSALQQLSTDSAEVVSIVTATVDKAFIDACVEAGAEANNDFYNGNLNGIGIQIIEV